MNKIISKSKTQTEKLGVEFSKKLKVKDVICLYGELGSGKTTFVKGLARGLKVRSRVISPTFIIIRSHLIIGEEINCLYHVDLYRLESLKQIKEVGMKDILHDKKGIVVIEWPEKAKKILPSKRWEVYFEQIDKNTREILITASPKTRSLRAMAKAKKGFKILR